MQTTLSIASLLLGISLTAAEYHVTTTGDKLETFDFLGFTRHWGRKSPEPKPLLR